MLPSAIEHIFLLKVAFCNVYGKNPRQRNNNPRIFFCIRSCDVHVMKRMAVPTCEWMVLAGSKITEHPCNEIKVHLNRSTSLCMHL